MTQIACTQMRHLSIVEYKVTSTTGVYQVLVHHGHVKAFTLFIALTEADHSCEAPQNTYAMLPTLVLSLPMCPRSVVCFRASYVHQWQRRITPPTHKTSAHPT